MGSKERINALRIISWNIHGTNDRIRGPKNWDIDFKELLQNSDIFCLQETKENFSIPNYKYYNKNRQNSNSGGVCIGVHRSVEKLASEVKIDSEDLIAVRLKNVIKSPIKKTLLL